MVTIPNIISLIRLPLAFLFLTQSIAYRTIAILLAMISDGLDGFIARRYHLSSKFGTLLDPLSDRFFVFFVIGILIHEQSLSFWEASALICRDFSVILFGLYLVFTGQLTTYRFKAIWCGKVTTFLQFMVFLGITFGMKFPPFVFSTFILLGVLALLELYLSKEKIKEIKDS
ncbi:MAG: CDP-diacylglycerol--glycerol-3-phosphate 3-phosphatidyltransferase [Chlamydiae bacterium]|nr:CDP-diacylglycerol--glycerol-3-phosphate 3-phosphatidyltransferase [Chlamydiota bacterium]